MLNPHDTPGRRQVAYCALSKKVPTKAHPDRALLTALPDFLWRLVALINMMRFS
jgi:hypothetical protein